MLSIVLSAVIAVGVFGATFAAFDWVSGLILGVIAGLVSFVLLLRRGRKRIDAVMKDVESHMKGQRIDKAIEVLQTLRPHARWQPGLGASIDGQIGMVTYAHQREFEAARPYLEKAHPRLWQAHAMLAAAHFKKERFDEMERVFERAVKRNKGESLLWQTYAWCQWKRKKKDEAIKVLVRAQAALPKDERVKNQLLALQNDKKLKMNLHEPEWLAMHLERTIPAGATAPRPRYMPPARKLGIRHVRG
jgi:tetratricopeptide (TPR) repeat protein